MVEWLVYDYWWKLPPYGNAYYCCQWFGETCRYSYQLSFNE